MSDNKFDWKSPNIRHHRLTEKIIKNFDCGNENLNRVLFEKAVEYSKYLGLVTYVLENDEDIIAYYSLANDKLSIGNVDGFWEEPSIDINFKELFSDCNCFPAVKITHLAINNKYKRKGIATHLLNYVIETFTNNTNKTGCQFILVDALQTTESRLFYDKHKFEYATRRDVNQNSRLMFLCLIDKK